MCVQEKRLIIPMRILVGHKIGTPRRVTEGRLKKIADNPLILLLSGRSLTGRRFSSSVACVQMKHNKTSRSDIICVMGILLIACTKTLFRYK